MKDRVLTCVYCGLEYPTGTPAHGADVQALTDHIKVCEKHPMREAEQKISMLRNALVQLVGAGTRKELEAMELAIRTMPGPAADRIAAIDAIRALIETA